MAYSEIIIIVQLAGALININLIQVYASTANKQNSDVTEFYEQLRNTHRFPEDSLKSSMQTDSVIYIEVATI